MEVLQVSAELDQMRDLYKEAAPRRVLELGVYQGGTLREWLMYCVPAVVVAVDLDHVNEDDYEGWRWPATDLHVITGDSRSQDVQVQLRDLGPYDWAFIDADHGDEGVRTDTRTVAPLMASGGHLVYHDIIGDHNCPVYAPGTVVDEFEAQGYEVTRFVEGGVGESAHGIGVVKIP